MITKIIAPTNNVNDTSVVVYQYLVEENSEVKAGQEVIAVETSKATNNLESPVNGFIRFVAEVGEEIPNGDVLAVVAESLDELASYKKPVVPGHLDLASSASGFSCFPNLCAGGGIGKEQVHNVSRTPFGIFDHSVTLGETLVRNGDRIEKGIAVCKVRNGKKVETISAPDTGYVFWNKKPYETVKQGEAVGTISESAVLMPFKAEDVLQAEQYESLRISKAAQGFLNDKGLTAEALGLSGLVTVKSITERLNPEKQPWASKTAVPISQIPVSHAADGMYQKLSKAKRSEANFLSAANKDAVVSQATVLVPTQGIISACAEDPELARKFSSIIIFETSRLLRNYPIMTSIFDDGQIYSYDSINVGYALNVDDGLKVPVFKNSDQKNLETLMQEKDSFVEKYVSKELTSADLSGGTFTITDLSSTGCYMFNPVLNLGQSVILGVGGENTLHTDYPLILALKCYNKVVTRVANEI